MDPKLLTESGWKTVAQKSKVKDNGLQKALAAYENLEEDDYDARLKAIATVAQLAATLKKTKDVTPLPDVAKYLTNVGASADAEKVALTKEKALAAKTAVQAQKKAEAKGGEDEEEEEDEAADSATKLKNALKTMRTAKAPYYFVVCDAKPYGLVLSKKDIRKSAQAKKELAQLAGGSTRPPKSGECHFADGKYVFDMEKPPAGLPRILQKWVKDSTGLGIKVMVGTESSDDEEAPAQDATAP